MMEYEDIDRLVVLKQRITRIEDSLSSLHNCCIYEGTQEAERSLLKELAYLNAQYVELMSKIKDSICLLHKYEKEHGKIEDW